MRFIKSFVFDSQLEQQLLFQGNYLLSHSNQLDTPSPALLTGYASLCWGCSSLSSWWAHCYFRQIWHNNYRLVDTWRVKSDQMHHSHRHKCPPSFPGASEQLLFPHISVFLCRLWAVCEVQRPRDQESVSAGDRCRVWEDAPQIWRIAEGQKHQADTQWNQSIWDQILIIFTKVIKCQTVNIKLEGVTWY